MKEEVERRGKGETGARVRERVREMTDIVGGRF